MNTQQSASTFLGSVDPQAVRALPAGHVVALGTGGGQVSILSGRVWLTSGGDPSDHFLGAGESFEVRDSGQTLVETWSGGAPAVIAWRPRSVRERLRDRLARALHNADRNAAPTAAEGTQANGGDTGYRTSGAALEADRGAPGAA